MTTTGYTPANAANLGTFVSQAASGPSINAGYNGLRIWVEILLPAPDAGILGKFILGTSKLSSFQWVNVYNDLAGFKYDSGSDAGQRPGAGEGVFTLRNDNLQWSPRQSIYYGPGTLVRVTIGTDGGPTAWVGLTETWDEHKDGQSRYVEITALEPIYLLTNINNAAISPIGAGDDLGTRVKRILDAANWQFGAATVQNNGATLQATTLAQTLITELDLNADSCNATTLQLPNGSLLVVENTAINNSISGGDERTIYDYDADSLVTTNTDDLLLSHVDLANAGGTSQPFDNPNIGGRYQYHVTKRNDLIAQSDAVLTDIATYMLNISTQTYRPVSLQLDNRDSATTDIMYNVRVKDLFTFTGDGVTFSHYRVCRMTHEFVTIQGGVYWSTTLDFEPSTNSTYS